MGKPAAPPQGPTAYRDDPAHAETASMASAVLLDNVDAFPDEELPSYTDIPASSITPGASVSGADDPLRSYYEYPPTPPFSSHDLNYSEYRTRLPNYSTHATQLEDFVRQQLRYSPSYFVAITGTHTETRRNGNKETKDKITDFFIRINITYLLGHPGTGKIEMLLDNQRGYWGTIIPRLDTRERSEEEVGMDALQMWCQRYVADPSKVKSFTLKREIQNHDTKKLEQLLRSAISETNYRGHVSVAFPQQHQRVVIYSPGMLNEWRMTVWIRWLFYLSFLWIFAWPVLFFLTTRYEVVKGVYQYANVPTGALDNIRIPTVMSEVEWFRRWEGAIKRAALARMDCKDAPLEEEYREASLRAEARGEAMGRTQDIPRTGNAFADGALGLIGQGLRVAEEFSNARGWGGDC